jgi:bifunctional NMN adenylyltransferase/nudix hydrolase
MVSGTEIRKNISDKYLGSADWRAGVISARYGDYDKVYPTVDIAIYNSATNEFLFGRKPNQQLMRFIGGFVDAQDQSFEQAARRESMEETGAEVDGFEYIGSFQVDDWRYRRVADKIMTTFFLGHYVFGRVGPADDIAEIYWRKLDDITDEMFVPEHLPLLKKLKEFMEKKKK